VLQGWPIGWLIIRQASAHRIYTERKQAIQFRLKRRKIENPLAQQIPVEGFQMSNVKNDAVPLRNGPVVKGLRPDDVEQLIAAHARIIQSLEKNRLKF
jgi:hypothetical protein